MPWAVVAIPPTLRFLASSITSPRVLTRGVAR